MKTILNGCTLQPNAMDTNVGGKIEESDQKIHGTDGSEYSRIHGSSALLVFQDFING